MTDTDHPILRSLNPEQLEAVTTTEGPVLVIAGAGSGKTRVITHRIAWLVEEKGVAPWQIFAATFTNKAAEEMKHRIRRMLPGHETARLTVGTFHAICVMILRREAANAGLEPRFTIADDTDQLALIKACLRDLDIPSSRIKPEEIRGWISQAKILMATPGVVAAAFQGGREPWLPASVTNDKILESLKRELSPDFLRVYEMYEARLSQSNAVDFDDLLLRVVRMFRERPDVLAVWQDRWRYLLVDEYQDTNLVQCEFVRALAGREHNLCVVGDEDQSIYSWRGAEIENILNFPNEFEDAKIIRLERNYRSTAGILDAAHEVIERNTRRHGKNLRSERGEGEKIVRIDAMDERQEAAVVVELIARLHRVHRVPLSSIAIFYRVNALSRLFEDFLRESNILYRVIGGVRFYDRAEIKDLLAYLHIVVNPLDGLSLTRIINKPRRGIGDKTLTAMFQQSTSAGRSLWEQLHLTVSEGGASKKALAAMRSLIGHVETWRELSQTRNPAEILDRILRDTGYEASLGDPAALETMSRLENIAELRQALADYSENSPEATLDDFLEMVSLASAVDLAGDDADCVSLMSLHSAKGLEYPVVFMVGLEESIFPSSRSADAGGERFEEERRLFYVGVTRAKDLLFLSRADCRSLYGRHNYNPPSTFLSEIPKRMTQTVGAAAGSMERVAALLSASSPAAPARNPEAGRSLADAAAPTAAASSSASGGASSGAPPPLFPPGSRIRHARLGEGRVLEVRGEGETRKIAVRFDAGVQVEILERYGGLEAVGETPF